MKYEINVEDRKRINELEKQIKIYENYKVKLISFVDNLKQQYINREISFEEYHSVITSAFKERSFSGLINIYDVFISKSKQGIRKIKEKNEKIKLNKKRTTKISLALACLLLIIFSFTLYKYGAEITGFVVFTREISNKDILDIEFNHSQYYLWEISQPQEINSLMITGKVIGEGSAGIYLLDKEKRYLIYEAQNREKSLSFSDVCLETCILPTLNKSNYRLAVELKNSRLILNSISYSLVEVYDIDIYPKKQIIQFQPELKQKYNLVVLNKVNQEFDATVYVEGNISSFISLSESRLYFTKDDETKKLSYEVTLPEYYAPGTYYANIVVRYLPDGKFKGEAPRTLHTIELNVPFEEYQASAEVTINKIDDENVELIIPVINIGNQKFTAYALVEIYKDNEKVKTLQTHSVVVEGNSRQELSIPWRSYIDGIYHVAIKLFYEDKILEIEKDFTLEKSSVLISEVDISKGLTKEEVSFDVWVKNNYNRYLHGVYFELFVYDQYNNLYTKVVSDLIDISQKEEIKLTASINPKEFIPGIYNFRIVMHYDDNTVETSVNAEITKDSLYIIEEKEEVKDKSTLYLIIFIVALIIMNLVWLAYYIGSRKNG